MIQAGKRLLWSWFGYRGRLRAISRPVYTAVVALELASARLFDLGAPRRTAAEDRLLGEVTAVIKTFERPRILRRLIRSIRRFYPDLALIVVDDSRRPIELPDATVIPLPFNSGVSAGRQAGLDQVQTPYVIYLDDDHLFFRYTNIEGGLALLNRHAEIDLMGGRVLNLPLFSVKDYRRKKLYPTTARPVHPPGSQIGPLTVYEKVASFFMARTDRLRLVGWDPAIKRLEHNDFATRARGVLTTVYNPDLQCLHAPTPFQDGYMAYRLDLQADVALIKARYNMSGRQPDQDIDQ